MATAGRPLRLRKSDLFRSLGYEPHAGQLEVHRCRAKRRVVACGTRWGKSTLGVYEAIAELLQPREHALGWIVAPTYELTSRIFARVVEVLHEKLKHRIRAYSLRGHWISVINLGGGVSELRAKTADRPSGLLGEALDFVIIDEATTVRDEVFDDHIAPRLVDRKGRALLLSTPGGPNWFYKEFRRGQHGKDSEYASFAKPTWTNPHVPAEAIEAERKRLGGELFMQQYGAEFLGVENFPCDTCGGPSVEMVSCTVVFDGGDDPPLCPECGKYVDEKGRTKVWLIDGKHPYTMAVHVQNDAYFEKLRKSHAKRIETESSA